MKVDLTEWCCSCLEDLNSKSIVSTPSISDAYLSQFTEDSPANLSAIRRTGLRVTSDVACNVSQVAASCNLKDLPQYHKTATHCRYQHGRHSYLMCKDCD